MTRGPKPKPTAIKALDGNPGKRPLNDMEPIPDLDDVDCPSWLDEDAREEWLRVYGRLVTCRVMTPLDMAVLADYCQSYSQMARAERNIQKYGDIVKTPSGYVQQAPHVGMYNQASKRMKQAASELGLTPSSRSRIQVKDDGGGGLESLLGGNPN